MAPMRERLGLTSPDLARELRVRGLPFHQQTIQRMEAGEQPVRLNEAMLIAGLLHADVVTMMSSRGSASGVRAWLELASVRLAQCGTEITKGLRTEVEVIEETYAGVYEAWHHYIRVQNEQGQPVDAELEADLREYRLRYERAMKACLGILELGEF